LPRQSQVKASKPNVYEVINNDEVRKVVTLHVNNNLCFFKHGRKITARYDVGDLYTNGSCNLGQFFQRLELQAGKQKIAQLKVAPWENIFENISIDKFKKNGQQNIKIIKSSATQPGDPNNN